MTGVNRRENFTWLNILLWCVFGGVCFTAVKFGGGQKCGLGIWDNFLQWRIVWVLAVPSVLMHVLYLFGFKRGWQWRVTWDTGLNSLIFLGFIISAGVQQPQSAQYWIGLFYLFALTVKAAILFQQLMFNLRLPSKNFNRGLLVCLIWFFTAYASWQSPVHGVSGDEPHYLLMAHSLLYDGNLNLFDEYSQGEYLPFYPHHLIPKPSDIVRPGLIRSRGLGASFSITLIPAYLFASYPGTVVFMALMTALMIFNLFLFLEGWGFNRKPALQASMITAISIPVILYSSLIYPDILASLLIILALRLFQTARYSSKGRTVPLKLIILSAGLLTLKFRYITVVVLLMTGGFYRFRRKSIKKSTYILTALAAVAAYFLADFWIFKGDLFWNRFGGFPQLKSYLPDWRGLLVIPGLLFDQEAGLLWLAPVYFLVIPGIRWFSGKRFPAYWIILLAPIFTVLSLLGHFAWHCLPTPPLRYLLPVLPPLAVFIAKVFERWKKLSSSGQSFISTLLILSVIQSLILSIQPQWQVNLADGTALLFEDLSRVLKIPWTAILPSFIRPDLSSLIWSIIGLAGLVGLFRRSRLSKQNNQPSLRMVVPKAVLVIICTAGILGISALKIPHFVIEAEDIFVSHPNGGTYYPQIRDPFFHRENQYGWTLNAGNSLNLKFPSVAGKSHLFIRAKLKNSSFISNLTVQLPGDRINHLNVTNQDWFDFILPLSDMNGGRTLPITIRVPDYIDEEIVIDRIILCPTPPWKWKLLKRAADVCDSMQWPHTALKFLVAGLIRHPGDPWYDFESELTPQVLHPVPLRERKGNEISRSTIEQYIRLAKASGMPALLELEKTFRVSIFSEIPDNQIRPYLLQKIQTGYWKNLDSCLKELSESDPDENTWKLFAALKSFREKRFAASVRILKEIRLNGWYQFSLNALAKLTHYVPEAKHLLIEMNNDSGYLQSKDAMLQEILQSAIIQQEAGNMKSAGYFLFIIYRLDTSWFIKEFLKQDSRFLKDLYPELPLRFSDFIQLAKSFYNKRRINDAEICVRRALEVNPSSAYAHYLLAKILNQMGQLEEAETEAIHVLSLSFSSDAIRNLIEEIRINKKSQLVHMGQTVAGK